MNDAIARAAAELGVSANALLAVADVASGGIPLLPDGRPVVRFERHTLHQRLAADGRDADGLARIYPGLVHPQAGGSRDGAREWYRVKLATQIAGPLAVESTRYGLFQILGADWPACGLASFDAFIAAMGSADGQVDAFVKLVEPNTPLVKALKARRWPTVARLYFGTDVAAALAAAYAQRAGADDAPADEEPAA